MKARKLRFSAIVQRRGSTVDANGEPDTTWTTLATVRCAIDPLLGNEYFAASGEGSKTTTKVRIRYESALATFTPEDRLSIGGKVYDVQSIINVQNLNEELLVMCSVRDRD